MTTTNTANGPQDHVAYRMETSRDLLDWLGGEFASRTRPRAGNGKDSPDQASSPGPRTPRKSSTSGEGRVCCRTCYRTPRSNCCRCNCWPTRP